PAGTTFATPARLTLPYVTTASPLDLAMAARVGASWSSLLDPSADTGASTITASMHRASGALGVLCVTLGKPKITAFSPSTASVGDVVFIDGSGFDLAPITAPSPSPSSSIALGSTSATILGWSDGALSFVVPSGASSGAIAVTTPGGSSISSTSLTIQ